MSAALRPATSHVGPSHPGWKRPATPLALRAALIPALALAALPQAAPAQDPVSWTLPGGGVLEIAPADGDEVTLATPLGEGRALLLDQVGDSEGRQTLRLSDGEINDSLGLRWQFFFLDLVESGIDTLARGDLDRLRAGIAPGAEFLGETNDESHPRIIVTADRLGYAQDNDANTRSLSWEGLRIETLVLGALSSGLPGLVGRLGVEHLGLDGEASLRGENGAADVLGATALSVNAARTHNLELSAQMDQGALVSAQILLREDGELMPGLREAGRLEQLDGGLIGGAGRGALMAAGFGLSEAGEIADALQQMLQEGGALALEITPDAPIAIEDLAAWPERDLAGRRDLAAQLGLRAAHQTD